MTKAGELFFTIFSVFMAKAGVVAPITLIVFHAILQFFMAKAGVVAPINLIVFHAIRRRIVFLGQVWSGLALNQNLLVSYTQVH